MVTSKFKLMVAFVERQPIVIHSSHSGVRSVRSISFKFINSLMHEDGSGRSFMVEGIDVAGNKIANLHVRTID